MEQIDLLVSLIENIALLELGWVNGPIDVRSQEIGKEVTAPEGVSGNRVLMVHGIKLNTHAHLTKIVEASSGMILAFGTREGRQEHACQNGDDGNDHQEFDQGEGLGPLGG